MEKDVTHTYTSNVTTDGAHGPNDRMRAGNEINESILDLPGRDSVTLGVADTSKVATPNYSKRPFGKIQVLPNTHLCEFC